MQHWSEHMLLLLLKRDSDTASPHSPHHVWHVHTVTGRSNKVVTRVRRRWRSCTEKSNLCVCSDSREKDMGGYGGSFVVWSRSKELRNWGAGSKVIRPGLLKSGCTSPRCEAWRLTRWKAGSSPARAPGRLWVPVSLQCRSATCRLCRQIPWSCRRCVYHCW